MKRVFKNLVAFIRLVIGSIWAVLLFEVLTIVTALGCVLGLIGLFVEPGFKETIDSLMDSIEKWCHEKLHGKEEDQ